MADKHLNIFYAYRQGNPDDSQGERVLENNVTRALIVALRSSDFVTKKFLEEFTGISTQGPYEHDLQSRLESDETESGKRGRLRGRCLVVVAGRPEKPKSVQGTSEEIPGGSRPDAWIKSTSMQFTALFENKLHSGIDDAQIRRHIGKNFGGRLEPSYFLQEKFHTVGRNQVPVVLWSWRDVYKFFSQFRDKQPLSLDPKPYYIVCQFLDYLEVIGMGEVKFTQDDFLTWERYTDVDEIGMLHGRVKVLGEDLAAGLEEHFMEPQNRSRGYLGVNVMHDGFSGTQSDQVPHWSCGLALGSRDLRLYIQCEAKPLVEKLMKQRDQLELSLTEALWEARGFPGLMLRVEDKFHIAFGGTSTNQSLWHTNTSFPLEICQNKEALLSVVRRAFDTLDHLHNPEVRKNKLEAAGRGISTWGVLQLLYHWNWLELEKTDIAITEQLKEVASKLRPYYDVLVEAYRTRAPRRRRQSEQGN